MSKNTNSFSFDFSPKIIKFLGEELIHDKKIAIMELIKNAYDADADKVYLTIKDDEIIIEDNGHGMTEQIVRDNWLKIGDSQKAKNIKKSPKYKRLPIGEKGIGRLGVHRLGNTIQVISKAEDSSEVIFKIDWNRFEQAKNLNNLEPIEVISREEPKYFLDNKKHGTKLIIQNLKDKIGSHDLRALNIDLLKLLPPFKHAIQENFNIVLTTQNGLFEDTELLDISTIIGHALFHYRVVIENNHIQEFNYHFSSPNEGKIVSKKITKNDDEFQRLWIKLKEKHSITHKNLQVGKIIFEGYIFDDRYSTFFGILNKEFKKTLKDYLKENGGIRVYRDGMRVYNYGEGGKDNDILDLERKRAKRIGDHIGYNQFLAIVELDREGSRDLIEKTNREGFIHNHAFFSLKKQLDICMDAVLQLRIRDRANMEVLLGKEYDKADINTKIKKITTQVNKLNITEKEKLQLKKNLHEFSQEFEQLKNIFLTASNTGLNMTFIVHDIDKIINHLEEKINTKDIIQIESVFIHLKKSIEVYKDVIRLDKKTSNLLVESLIEQAKFNFDYRFESHAINFNSVIEHDLNIIGKKGLILGIFTNLFDNAIYWLRYYEVEHKKIYVYAYQKDGDVYIIIADNGKGFNISFEAALQPFIGGRIDESGMGIGLHLAEQVMIAHKGSITHGSWQEEKLPAEFSQGAIIKLKFRKE